ncbi:MAG: transposase [Clostridia bacterium]|nr:transposase [Clostridia bacterium]
MENKYRDRKSTHLKTFDYSTAGAYFATLCVQDRKQLLSRILPPDPTNAYFTAKDFTVDLTPPGRIAEEQLHRLEDRYPAVSVSDYVIMPDHIHCIIFLKESDNAEKPALHDIICTYKSLTSRFCKQQYGTEKLFQRSYAEHIIRDREDYLTRRKYILENPARWYFRNRHV